MDTWEDMRFWNSGEWQVLQERLDELDDQAISYCPSREDLFTALDLCSFESTKLVIVAQDPYPNPVYCTGLAFGIPAVLQEYQYPPTLRNIYKELDDDLHIKASCGDLGVWANRGVLLWNSTPTCLAGKSLSHVGWEEWSYLTKEILETVSVRHKVFALLGSRAQEYREYISTDSLVLELSHPSPRGAYSGRRPFMGSRFFSTLNAMLTEQGEDPIDWRI